MAFISEDSVAVNQTENKGAPMIVSRTVSAKQMDKCTFLACLSSTVIKRSGRLDTALTHKIPATEVLSGVGRRC